MNRSVELTELEQSVYDLYIAGYTQTRISEKLYLSTARIEALMNKISCKLLYKEVLMMYHLPKDLPLRAFNLLYTDEDFKNTKNIDLVNTANFDQRRFCCNLDKIIVEGERY